MKKYRELLTENFDFEFTLRDFLALERTAAANTRTLLAFIRTAIGMFGAGIALVKVTELAPIYVCIGWTLMLLSPIPLVVGFAQYSRVKTDCDRLLDSYTKKCERQRRNDKDSE